MSQKGRTVTAVFRNFPGSELPGREIVRPSNFGRNRVYAKMIDVVPASLDLDNTEIELTSAHQGESAPSAWNKRTLMCRWLEETGLDDEYDYILFDCAPATKIVSQNAIAASHGYILPLVPEAVMERGAPHLRDMIETGIDRKLKAWARAGEPRRLHVGDTQLVGVTVTRIQIAGNAWSGYTNDHTQHLNTVRGEWGKRLVKPYIKQGVGVAESLSDRVPVYDLAHTQNVGKRNIHEQFKALTDKLKARMDQL